MYETNWPNAVLCGDMAQFWLHGAELYGAGAVIAKLVSVICDFMLGASFARYALPKLKPGELEDMKIWF